MTDKTRSIRVAALVGLFGVGALVPRAAGAPESPPQTEFVGVWQGTLAVGQTRLRIVFHVGESSDGELEGMLDSPDQGAMGIPVETVTVAGDSIRLDIGAINAIYAGRLTEERQAIDGEWRQGGLAVPLELERVKEAPVLRRPQEPEPPYPYQEEAVEIEVPGAGVTLAGTLTLPPGGGPDPAVVLVSGSGAQDRDETVAGHHPFLVLADHLSRGGVAVLRMDDRDVGGSQATPRRRRSRRPDRARVARAQPSLSTQPDRAAHGVRDDRDDDRAVGAGADRRLDRGTDRPLTSGRAGDAGRAPPRRPVLGPTTHPDSAQDSPNPLDPPAYTNFA